MKHSILEGLPTIRDWRGAAHPVRDARRERSAAFVLALAAATLASGTARAQTRTVTFSIDWHGPTVATSDFATAQAITEGDVLTPTGGPGFGPLPPPTIVFDGDMVGIANHSNCVGHPAGDPCGVELDALSYGTDAMLTPNQTRSNVRFLFSTDEYAVGAPLPTAPSVSSEAMIGDSSADVWVDTGLPSGPLPPGTTGAHAPFVDGDGVPSSNGFAYPGLGLVEPNFAGVFLPNTGDNVDAFDVGPAPSAADGAIFFSLDAGFADALSGANNSASAGMNAFRGGDVLRRPLSGGLLQLYATATSLGLDAFGPGTDDLDALVLRENGTPGFQAADGPYGWLDGSSDMILFSVRRGSAVIGSPDSIFGAPIEEGDLLVPPVAGGSGFPGIFIAAEALGLRATRTSPLLTFGDDLNAGDVEETPFADCNENGIEDSVDIATGASSDNNMNGIPDECEQPGDGYCYCAAPLGPCGNHDATGGCADSTGEGAQLTGSGSSSVGADDLVLTTTRMPAGQFGIFFMGPAAIQVSLGDGLSCVGPSADSDVQRFPPQGTGAGAMTVGPGLVALACSDFQPSACVTVGSTWNFQTWFRDPQGACGTGTNLSNAWSVCFTP